MSKSDKQIPDGRNHIGLYRAKRQESASSVIDGCTDTTTPLFYQLTIPNGHGNMHVDLDHPLASAVKRSALNGNPGDPWHFICVKHPNIESPTVIGALSVTSVGRLLFFPGSSISFTMSDELGRFAGKQLDHFTLAPPHDNKWRSHTTLREGDRRFRHGLNVVATERPGLMLPWLTMLTPNFKHFHPLPAKLTMTLECPQSDTLRYTQEAIGSNYKQCAVVDAPQEPDGESFWQVDFLVGRGENWRDLEYGPLHYLDADNIVEYDIGENENREGGTIITEIVPEFGVIVIVTRPKGLLKCSCFLTPPDEWFVD